ncbi:MAG: phosphatase PAP2 family protein [Verrucomicrobia bacterium]|nr:phosphatase PAP2 family protein [Verrucomicrobiota bacterium]
MSDDHGRTIQKQLLLASLLCALLLTAGYFAFVNTAWGHKVDEDAYFGREVLSWKIKKLNLDILDLVGKTALLAAAMVLLAIAAVRRSALVGILAVAGFGGAVVGAEILKRVLPWRVLVPEDANLQTAFQAGTYPSGHATIGTSFAMGLLLVSSPRWRLWLTVVGGCISAIFAVGVLFAGWHRPSDSLGALAWSGFCMTVAAAFAIRLRGQPVRAIADPGRATLSSAGMAILLATATWVLAAPAASNNPGTGLPFLLLACLIIAGAFSLIAWYGWQLRGIDWCVGGTGNGG